MPFTSDEEGLSVLACGDCITLDYAHLPPSFTHLTDRLPSLSNCLRVVQDFNDAALTRYVAVLFGRRVLNELVAGNEQQWVDTVGYNNTPVFTGNPFRHVLFSNTSPLNPWLGDDILPNPVKDFCDFVSHQLHYDFWDIVPLSCFSIASGRPRLCILSNTDRMDEEVWFESQPVPLPDFSQFLRSFFGLPVVHCTSRQCSICRYTSMKDFTGITGVFLPPVRSMNFFFGCGDFHHLKYIPRDDTKCYFSAYPLTPSVYTVTGLESHRWVTTMEAALFLDKLARLDSDNPSGNWVPLANLCFSDVLPMIPDSSILQCWEDILDPTSPATTTPRALSPHIACFNALANAELYSNWQNSLRLHAWYEGDESIESIKPKWSVFENKLDSLLTRGENNTPCHFDGMLSIFLNSDWGRILCPQYQDVDVRYALRDLGKDAWLALFRLLYGASNAHAFITSLDTTIDDSETFRNGLLDYHSGSRASGLGFALWVILMKFGALDFDPDVCQPDINTLIGIARDDFSRHIIKSAYGSKDPSQQYIVQGVIHQALLLHSETVGLFVRPVYFDIIDFDTLIARRGTVHERPSAVESEELRSILPSCVLRLMEAIEQAFYIDQPFTNDRWLRGLNAITNDEGRVCYSPCKQFADDMDTVYHIMLWKLVYRLGPSFVDSLPEVKRFFLEDFVFPACFQQGNNYSSISMEVFGGIYHGQINAFVDKLSKLVHGNWNLRSELRQVASSPRNVLADSTRFLLSDNKTAKQLDESALIRRFVNYATMNNHLTSAGFVSQAKLASLASVIPFTHASTGFMRSVRIFPTCSNTKEILLPLCSTKLPACWAIKPTGNVTVTCYHHQSTEKHYKWMQNFNISAALPKQLLTACATEILATQDEDDEKENIHPHNFMQLGHHLDLLSMEVVLKASITHPGKMEFQSPEWYPFDLISSLRKQIGYISAVDLEAFRRVLKLVELMKRNYVLVVNEPAEELKVAGKRKRPDSPANNTPYKRPRTASIRMTSGQLLATNGFVSRGDDHQIPFSIEVWCNKIKGIFGNKKQRYTRLTVDSGWDCFYSGI